MRGALVAIVIGLVSCSKDPTVVSEKSEAYRLPDLPNAVADEVRFPAKGRKSVELVPAKLLGYEFLGGGNVADYGTHRLFTIRCRSAQQAASYLFDIKANMKEPRFVASYGGYISEMPRGPLFVFAKGAYIGGVAGLPEKEAIEAGKEFAARL